jgi:uroporphyrinogen-III synthase
MRVLVTRPQEDSGRTAALLLARGHEPLLAPLFDVRAREASIPADVDAVIAASAHAIRNADPASLAPLTGKPLFAVGTRTATLARRAGFSRILVGEGGAAELAAIVCAECPEGSRLLHLAGLPRRDTAIVALQERYRLVVAETYETVARQALPAPIAQALLRGGLGAVLHFSPRAAQVFGDLAHLAGLLPAAKALVHVFISHAAIDARFPNRRIASRPSLESMVDAL